MGTISAVYSQVGPSIAGLPVAYHITLVYRSDNGTTSFVSAGPTISDKSLHLGPGAEAAAIANSGINVLDNSPSVWGTLKVQGSGTFNAKDPFNGVTNVAQTDPNTGLPNPNAGATYNWEVISNNVSDAQFAGIVQTYNDIASLHMTYSPTLQNSNSVACTALKIAGLPMPSDPGSYLAWGCGNNNMPTKKSNIEQYLNNMRQRASSPGQDFSVTQTERSDGTTIQIVDWNNPFLLDSLITKKNGVVTAIQLKNNEISDLSVFTSADVSANYTNVMLADNGLDVNLLGDANTIEGGIHYDLSVTGNDNLARVDDSNVQFYGSNNDLYGDSNSSYGAAYSGNDEFGRMASASQSPSNSISADKLIETMSAYPMASAAGSIRERPAEPEWATITSKA
ncbi:hypothetical protein [Duganella vulcania]|uniref:Uncharacterized protein n=1 Tax=Duganella vulcania TaxID=2692166 RepID=A0A845GML6_9BURK|nr:hypothetical protein [Duganella vulcania]MYM95201.1 hypothetical protein [Duganella vulcania]